MRPPLHGFEVLLPETQGAALGWYDSHRWCSLRPASNIVFSTDCGGNWSDHCVISDRMNFNYTAIREITPGHLLSIHDAQIPGTFSRINSVDVDVERNK